MDKTFRILTIDGGGIRGVFAAHILKRIRESLSCDFHQKFDLIAGTSTGSIIAAGLAIGLSTDKILELYKKKGGELFERNYSDTCNWFGWKNLWEAKYKNTKLKAALTATFGDVVLAQTKTNLMIPASDISNGNVFIFKSAYDPAFVRDNNTPIRDAVLASCSAPAFFKPVCVNGYLLADGGLWANNPALLALTEAVGPRFKIPKDRIRLLSIGTGVGKKYYDPKGCNARWGLWKWGTGLVDTVMSLNSVNVDNTTRFLMADEGNFMRLNFESDHALPLDDADTIENLVSRADEKFTYNADKILKLLS